MATESTTESTNLTLHRGGKSVWDQQDIQHSRGRAMSILGVLMIVAGTLLVTSAYTAELARTVRRSPKLRLWKRSQIDEINAASEESFPASDPPAWTQGVGKPAQSEGR